MWSIIKSGFSWLFGGGSSANEVIDVASKMADNAFFTDQEKSQANQNVLNWYLKYQEVTSAQNVARRIIAFMVVGLWVFLIMLAVAAWPFYQEYTKFIFKVLSDIVNRPFEIIIGFYFAVHLLRSVINNVQNKPADQGNK